MRVLNLYAGIGGNRKFWGGYGFDITAVELDPNIRNVYKDMYPNDTVIVADAHEYLQKHYKEYDIIWSSPPCQSHSSMRQNLAVRYRGTPAEYPDMKLYQEIIFLKYNFSGAWVVENVKPYYDPLIKPDKVLDRHYFWCNFDIPDKEFIRPKLRKAQIPELQTMLGINLDGYKLENKRQVLRNCVLPAVGEHVLRSAILNEFSLI